MNIIPAIDIINGNAVRLYKGKIDSLTKVGDAVEVAENFRKSGAPYLHVVDLDAAFNKDRQLNTIKKIASIAPIQLGGGIRTHQDVELLFDIGIEKVVLSTLPFENRKEFFRILDKHIEKVIVATDFLANGNISLNGWEKEQKIHVLEAIKEMYNLGIRTFLATSINHDGTLLGPSVSCYKEIVKVFSDITLLASGGVSSIEDIFSLQAIGIKDIVIGKALYNNQIDLKILWT